MRIYNLFFILFLLIFISCQNRSILNLDISLFNWSLVNNDSAIFLEGIDPSDVHIALLKAGVIPDPFYGANEKGLQWIGNQDWTFTTIFDLEESLLKNEKIELTFEGLDTYSRITLNDKVILSADNMFRTWRIDVAKMLKLKDNTLTIIFYSPKKQDSIKQKQLAYNLPDIRGFTRKAAYHSGWDWGPTFITSGIWKPAFIRAWNKAIIRDLNKEILHLDENEAKLMLETEIESIGEMVCNFQVFVNDKFYKEENIQTNRGSNQIKTTIQITNPKLWWPNGYGEQNLYNIKVVVLDEKEVIDTYVITTGLKKVELVQEPDSIGKSFYFKINGVPIFTKGANYIPQDNFLPRLSDEDYEKLILDAKKSNMNMLRVWGGGIYENDIFYKLCDQQGIMVWQDFMFACNMYPGDIRFMINVKDEAIDNIKRIRNHPSLVLWCGNNEVNEAWHNWGWQKQFEYSKEDSTEIWNNYLNLFENLLPGLVSEYDPTTPYWASSPSIGWGHNEALTEGDMHYWGVWWGREPFKKYEEKVGRFMSEYGFQGMPDLKTITTFSEPEDRIFGSEVMDVHQKHPFGWEAIQQYMEREYKVPDNFEDYAYVSQLLQAEGMKIAIEAHRRAKPYCMGTLYWQLNDCWPVTSWSGIDYYGRWKAMQYMVQKAYDTYLISFEERGESVTVYVVSDSLVDIDVLLTWKILNFEGEILDKGQKECSIKKNTSEIYDEVEFNQFTDLKSNIVLVVELWSKNELLNNAKYYFAKPKDLNLKLTNIDLEVQKINESYLFTLTSDKLSKAVCLECANDGFFSDNYFDMLPGEQKTISFTPYKKSNNEPEFIIKCLNSIN